MKNIEVKGAKQHNLKNIDVIIPRDKLTVITGLSGSGKSSLAFDTLYAEGQRRYVESLSSYARQFLSVMDKPDVDHINGLSPAISIEQKSTSHNPRSTVGTVTEIYDYLRLLYARVGTPFCPDHGISLESQSIDQIVDKLFKDEENERAIILCPIVSQQKGEHLILLNDLKVRGFIRAKIHGEIIDLDNLPQLNQNKKHDIAAVIDRLVIKKSDDIRSRISESIETSLLLSEGLIEVENMDKNEITLYSSNFSCSQCGYAVPELEPRMFSFNNPYGACTKCDGLGVIQFFNE